MLDAETNEFLTKKELAKLCRTSERTIDRLLEVGDAPPPTRPSPGRVIFSAASVREWLSKRTIQKSGKQVAAAAAIGAAMPGHQSGRRGRRRKLPANEATP